MYALGEVHVLIPIPCTSTRLGRPSDRPGPPFPYGKESTVYHLTPPVLILVTSLGTGK